MQPAPEKQSVPAAYKQLAALGALAASGRAAIAKPAHFKAVCDVDIAALVERIGCISDAEWDAESARRENNFEVFEETRHIIARFNRAVDVPEKYHENESWARWAEPVLPVMTAVASHYEMAEPDFPKVMFARLEAGGEIAPHRDIGLANHLTHKIHVPLVTNDRVRFWANGKSFQLPVGKAYELNNVGLHSVRNDGAEDRIHLIFELFDRATIR
jgi:hypothetical protein